MTAPGGLELHDVTVVVGRRTVLDGLTMHVPAGSTLAVTGSAGSGKSSVLATLAGLRPPAAGRLLLGSRPVQHDQVGHAIGYVPQVITVLDALTAVENVALTLLARPMHPATAWTTADQHLDDLGLAPTTRHNLAEQLSGGQRQRVAFARATVGQPLLLIADDPTSELDPATAQRLLAVMAQLASRGSTVVLATTDHELALRADLRLTIGGV